ncbi:hypothetical protein BDZ91DRAFT_849110 [Kalaharituber pfeilii]|nr:hypothetical protein BDZ91DRAFT_849110 [Kalaharituber pfeilii]
MLRWTEHSSAKYPYWKHLDWKWERDPTLPGEIMPQRCNALKIKGPQAKDGILQLSPNPVLTPEQQDEPCDGLDHETLLLKLNALTGYQLSMNSPNLSTGLNLLINESHDFGIAYAWFRTAFIFKMQLSYLPAEHLDEYSLNAHTLRVEWVPEYVGLPPFNEHTSIYGNDALDRGITAIDATDPENETITHPTEVHPRRLWDLLANRVVPYHWHGRTKRIPLQRFLPSWNGSPIEYPCYQKQAHYVGLSHSWASDICRNVLRVNNQQWPVPLPHGVTIEAVRDELLSFRMDKIPVLRCLWTGSPLPNGFEYCWLDALCLRQAWTDNAGTQLVEPPRRAPQGFPLDYRQLEHTRLEEWKTDVPTIGGVFKRAAKVFLYLNGIGKPLSVDEADWASPYHWMNRAWTLQEYITTSGPSGPEHPFVLGMNRACTLQQYICRNMKTLGIDDAKLRSAQGKMMDMGLKDVTDVNSLKEPLKDICKILQFCEFAETGYNSTFIFDAMARRYASNPVDKVAGICYLLGPRALPRLPVYKPNENPELAWVRLLRALSTRWKWELCLTFSRVCAPNQLFPTWSALMSGGKSLLPLETATPVILVGPPGISCQITFKTERYRGRERVRTSIQSHIENGSFGNAAMDPETSQFGQYFIIPNYFEEPQSDFVQCLICKPRQANGDWDGVSFLKIGTCVFFKPIRRRGQSALNEVTILRQLSSGTDHLFSELQDLSPAEIKAKYGTEKSRVTSPGDIFQLVETRSSRIVLRGSNAEGTEEAVVKASV